MAIQLGQVKPALSSANPAQQSTDLQLQQAAGQLTQQGLTPQKSQIQQVAGQVAATKGQAQVADQQKQVQQAQQNRQLAASEQKVQKVKQLLQTKQAVVDLQMKNTAAVDSLQMNMQQKYVDEVKKFQKDEIGRTVFNTRQLSDWAALKAKNEEEFGNYEQMMLQALEKKNAIMDHSFKVISQHLEQEYLKAEQAKDQAATEQINAIRQDIEKKKLAAKKKAALNSQMWVTGATVVAMVAATVATAGMAAPAAAAIISTSGAVGGAAGGIAASQS